MSIFSKFENKMDDAVDNAAGAMFNAPIQPAQVAKKAEKMMMREKLVGAGCQYAPTLYTVLVNQEDDKRLFSFYPTMAAEIETYLVGRAEESGLVFDCRPLVRFIAQDGFKSGKFDVVAENVAGSIIEDLRREESEYYGLSDSGAQGTGARQNAPGYAAPAQMPYAAPNGGASQAPGAAPYAQQPASQAVPQGYPAAQPYGAPQGYGTPASGVPQGYGAPSDAYADDYDAVSANPQNGYAALYGAPGYQDEEGYAAGAVPYGNNQMPQTVNLPGRGQAAGAVAGNAGTMRAQQSEPFLVDMQDNRSFPLVGNRAVIGRESASDFQIMDSNVSRSHAEVFVGQDGRFYIRDLGSTNGTKVNGHRVNEAPLSHGDIITLGTSRVEFREN